MVRGARPHPRVRVLQATIDEVGIAVVHGDPVELRDREAIEPVVGVAEVPALVQSAVAAEEQMATVSRVNPEHVMIVFEPEVVGWRIRHLIERCAAILALHRLHAHQPDALVGRGIDERMTVIHRARVAAARASPVCTGIVGAIEARAGLMLDRRDHHVRIRLRHGDADSAFSPAGIPFSIFRHVAPPSVDFQSALPGPPPLNPYTVRSRWYVDA